MHIIWIANNYIRFKRSPWLRQWTWHENDHNQSKSSSKSKSTVWTITDAKTIIQSPSHIDPLQRWKRLPVAWLTTSFGSNDHKWQDFEGSLTKGLLAKQAKSDMRYDYLAFYYLNESMSRGEIDSPTNCLRNTLSGHKYGVAEHYTTAAVKGLTYPPIW